MSIYTRKGDGGMTGMLSGAGIGKDNLIIELLGAMDSMTSHLGVARTVLDQDVAEEVQRLQDRLVAVMGLVSSEFRQGPQLLEDVEYLEGRIDHFQSLYPAPESFILPGSDRASAQLDVARTAARRVERLLAKLSGHMELPKDVSAYFNRLSDYIYAMARMVAFREEVKKSMNRGRPLLGEQAGVMNLQTATSVAQAVEEAAGRQGCSVVVSIVNQDGAPILTRRMDHAFVVSFSLARKKAYTAALLKMPTHKLGELTAPGGEFEGLENMIDEEIVTLGGGYPIEVGGTVIGAIGVSGSTVDNDRSLAEYGSQLLTLEPLLGGYE